MQHVVTVVTRAGTRTRRYDDEVAARAAADRQIARLVADGMRRTGGHPITGAIVTAHLRPVDRRRTATAKVLVEVHR